MKRKWGHSLVRQVKDPEALKNLWSDGGGEAKNATAQFAS